MHLSSHDLQQLDEDYLRGLSPEQLQALSGKLLADLKEAHDRLNQNPSNSSRPPSSQTPWGKADNGVDDELALAMADDEAPADRRDEEQGVAAAVEPDKKPAQSEAETAQSETKAGRPGRRKGAPGVSRTQQLPVDAEQIHRPETCAGCGKPLGEELDYRPYTARFELDVVPPDGTKCLVLRQTKHTYLEAHCHCGHCTRARPGRAAGEADWTVELSEWYLAGPTLVALICALALRMRLSRARIQEFLHDWLGLELGVATINQLHPRGRSCGRSGCPGRGALRGARNRPAPCRRDQLERRRAAAVAVGVHLRQRDPVHRWQAYPRGTRPGAWRNLRPLADERWLLGLSGLQLASALPSPPRAQSPRPQGKLRPTRPALRNTTPDTLDTLMAAVYQARGAPPGTPLRDRHGALLTALFHACTHHAQSSHEKTRALARELLNDWDTFWVVLDYPWLPLTNNEAERALRHWVIARRIGNGTRTAQGTLAFANLASIIETCRKRSVSPWPYLAEVLRQRRQGLPAPALPTPVAAAVIPA